MPNTMVRVFERLSDAQNARNQLLGSGFSESGVNLRMGDDEAGPVDGNFIMLEKGAERRSKASGQDPRIDGYGNPGLVWRSSIVLTVEAGDDDQGTLASDILDRCGAIDVEARTTAQRQQR